MIEFLTNLVLNFRIVDALDIILMAIFIYWILIFIKGTRAAYMLTGLGIGLLAVWLSNVRDFELFTTHWVLRSFFNNLPLIIIVLFQCMDLKIERIFLDIV